MSVCAARPGCFCAACEAARRAVVRRVTTQREERATGLRCWRGSAHAIGWYAGHLIHRSSPRSIALHVDRVDGGGRDRAEVEARKAAAVAFAIGAAERDELERHPARPAPVRTWLLQHFAPGIGRSFAWIAESGGWHEADVAARVQRAARVVGKRLRANGWFEDDRQEEVA